LREHVLNLFENRVLRMALRSKRGEVTVDLKRLHNEELHNLYCCKGDEMGRACGTHGERGACSLGKPEGRETILKN
jgi:hypothetical protein